VRIVIFGKNGQLGQELEKEAKNKEFEVLALGHEEIDVANYETLKALLEKEKPDLLINAAAYNLVREADEQFEKAFELNCFAPFYMASICKKIGAKFVTYSTDYVFDGEKNEPYTEDDQTNPLQIYGLSKSCGEASILHAYPKGSFVIRTCAVYGGQEGSKSKGGNIVLTILKQAKEKEYLEMTTDQIVNPTYSKDLAKASLDLLDKKPEPGIYHLTSEGSCTWYEFAKECLRIAKISKEIRKVEASKIDPSLKRPKFTALANVKAKALGIALPNWQESLKAYIKDFSLA